ncbi:MULTISPECIES: hypothetical protein [unclassified Bradyrhizobium]|uniref:hypothetical protein n=1 Tax=unclassified Bradyrhizobium TaxID=2631580 RepID=UPI001CD244E9|nr:MULTISPECIES: hypothetical protein [unclassified Bradyrhizobium]MCA1378923.1 hypothetical protein [Bradyrhizobium sp. IC4060]MCA1488581.1 hypothetical protein [Bradyrhizobium sp. IC4061]
MKVLTAHGMMRPVNAPLFFRNSLPPYWWKRFLCAAELDFKYNTRKKTDGERTATGVRRIDGKRLMMYRPKGKKQWRE